MVSLDTAANVAEIVGALTVLGAVLFAMVQIAEVRRQRRQEAALGLMQSMFTPEVQAAIRATWWLPDGITAADVRARGPAFEETAVTMIWACENLGVLVHERVLDLATVDKLIGGTVRDAYRRLKPWLDEERQKIGSATFGEWFEWLAEQLETHGDPRKREGAYARYRDWRP